MMRRSAGPRSPHFDALDRTAEAKALRERYGLTAPENPKAS